MMVPRKLATFSRHLDPALLARLQEILLAIDEQDRASMVEMGGWNWEFLSLDDESHDGIEAMKKMIETTDGLVSD